MNYTEFLQSKKTYIKPSGFDMKQEDLNPLLFEFQKDITIWSLKKGKAAVFINTGLGKSLVQLEWAKHVCTHTNGNVLILAPLAVSNQTVREGLKLGIVVNLCRSQDDVKPGINIINYDILHKFDTNQFSGVVLDESGILKNFSGETRKQITESFVKTPFKLACSATPSPNSYMELGTHAEFLNIMSRTEMLATYFVHDGKDTAVWRLKKHAQKDFWAWIASWAVMMKTPFDLGYDGSKFDLPELRIHEIVVDHSGYVINEAKTLDEQRRVRKNSVNKRVAYAAKIANQSDDSCLLWCNFNYESEMLSKEVNFAIQVTGSDTNEFKAKSVLDFANGTIKKLVSKPIICGYGMNLQICHKIIFVGISHSFESYYQAIRRCWRFGQTHPVDVYVITSEREGAVVKNIKRKEKEFDAMLSGMISATSELTKDNIKKTENITEEYNPQIKMILPAWL